MRREVLPVGRSARTVRRAIPPRWIFDAEIIARLIARFGVNSEPAARDVVYEYPLHAWMDVRGPKVGPSDYLRAAVDLYRIYNHYPRPSLSC